MDRPDEDERERPSGYCWSCGYLLRGVASDRCPECGRAFDRADRSTMNFGRPMGRVGRWAVGRLGWAIPAVAAAAAGLVGATVRWPVEGWRFSMMDVPYYAAAWEWRGARRAGMTWVDAAYTAGLALAALAVVLWLLRVVMRGIAVARYRPPRFQRGRFWGRSVLVAAALGVVIGGMGVGWPYRLGQRAAVEYAAARTARGILMSPSFAQNWVGADEGRYVTMMRAAVLYGDARQRTRGLKLLVEHRPEEVGTWLRHLAASERDPAVKALLVRLVALRRHTDAGPWLVDLTNDADAGVRAAAADALGVLNGPGYQLAESWLLPLTITTDPPIDVTRVVDRLPPARVPAGARDALERVMRTGPTAGEREAAARALVRWPPANYRLRLAEWGVWQTVDAAGGIAMARAQMDGIPPFVHRAGNPASEFTGRLGPTTIYWKPVIHLTANVPLAVDLQVYVTGGRVWFAYPKPDDFVLSLGGTGSGLVPPALPATKPPVAALDPQGLAPLTGLHTGYPWLLPAHPTYPRGVWPGRGQGPDNVADIVGIGVRWQSVIVSPTRPAWLAPPVVGTDARHAWWGRLREVECSWAASRGEGERFLYYDGPTMVAAPVVPRLDPAEGGRIQFMVPSGADPEISKYRAARDRDGLLVEVGPGGVRGGSVRRLRDEGSESVEGLLAQRTGAAAVEGLLREALLARGLTASEAGGLLACWRATFFQTPGLRFLTLLDRADYDAACPLTVRPEPTEAVRVGVVFTELRGR